MDNFSSSNLAEADINQEYQIKEIGTEDEELKNFLLSLGCFAGASVTVLSILSKNYVICVKDARYSIDEELARSIRI